MSVSVYIEYQCLSSQVGDTPLMRAAWMGNTEIMAELGKGGADLNLQNDVCLFIYYIHHMMYMPH